jgi:hypothetical protein
MMILCHTLTFYLCNYLDGIIRWKEKESGSTYGLFGVGSDARCQRFKRMNVTKHDFEGRTGRGEMRVCTFFCVKAGRKKEEEVFCFLF